MLLISTCEITVVIECSSGRNCLLIIVFYFMNIPLFHSPEVQFVLPGSTRLQTTELTFQTLAGLILLGFLSLASTVF